MGEVMKFVMAYPAVEEFALSSLGYMRLFQIANEIDGIDAIRISTDFCNINVKDVDAIAFSISFDFDFIGVLSILERLNIPFRSSDRKGEKKYPLIFAGGPVITTNPRPYENIFDFMLIGDGEEVIKEVVEIIKNNPNDLEKIKDVTGVYIKGRTAEKRTEKLNNVIYTPVVTEKSYFKNTFVIEVARGCMNRCAFCTASYLNLPFRNYEYKKIIEAVELGLTKTNKIALLGAQISAHPHFNDIMQYLRNKIENGLNLEIGVSSLRTDAVSPDIIKTLVMGGQKHTTIAIEAASERLRKFINKNLKEEQILNAIKTARENGLKGLKIYSMIGIPNETTKDLEEFFTLAKKIKTENKGFNIEFSFSTFVPKPHTPFQWSKREDTATLEKKQKFLEKGLGKIGVSSKFSSPKWDFWQTVLSRSGDEIGELLIYVFNNGGKLGAYKAGVKALNINISKSINGFDFEEALPWDCISIYPEKRLLINEYNRLEKSLK